MKILTSTLFILTFFVFSSYSQKYALLDKKMVKPVIYTDQVTLQHSHEGYFPVEKNHVPEFVKVLEMISTQLSDKKGEHTNFNLSIGNTIFKSLIIKFGKEDRLDVTVTTNCGNIFVSSHLADASSGNWRNSFYINTWIKYIKKYN